MTSLTDRWPLAGLRLRTGDLQLRTPREADLVALADLAAEGVHDPDEMPFATPWSDAAPEERATSVLQWHWRCWGAWAPECWTLEFAVLRAGEVVGTQGMRATDFAVLRSVATGSWLGRRFHGQGIGRAMRAAVLALAFDGLGARSASSEAFTDNPASLAVSRALGYRDDGLEWRPRRGQAACLQRLRLDRVDWAQAPRPPVSIDGLEACLPWFGPGTLGTPTAAGLPSRATG